MTTSNFSPTPDSNVIPLSSKQLRPHQKGQILVEKFTEAQWPEEVILTEDEQENYMHYVNEYRLYLNAQYTTWQYVKLSARFFFNFEFTSSLGCLVWAYERANGIGDYHPRHGKFYRKGYLE